MSNIIERMNEDLLKKNSIIKQVAKQLGIPVENITPELMVKAEELLGAIQIERKKLQIEKVAAAQTMEKISETEQDPSKPYIGMGATIGCGSDCYPYTVIEISPSGKQITLQADEYHPDKENGYDYYGNQVYTYKPNPNGGTTIIKFRKTKRYPNGRWTTTSGTGVSLGHRRAYQDPHF